MSAVLGVFRYEYLMAVRRWGVWLAFAIAAAGSLGDVPISLPSTLATGATSAELWATVGMIAWRLNVMLPVVGGIALADRLARDRRLQVDEVLRSTPLSRRSYILGKYVGVTAATLTPVLVAIVLVMGALVVQGVSIEIIGAGLAAFVGINVPAYLFVAAFALACPVVIPVRVFQVLFTGYWFWGNFINPRFMPTLSETLLVPSGEYVRGAFFSAAPTAMQAYHTALEAGLNLVVLASCAAIALFALDRYLAWQEAQA